MDEFEPNSEIAKKQLSSIRNRIYQGAAVGFMFAFVLDLVASRFGIAAYVWYSILVGLGIFLFLLPFVLFDRVNQSLTQKPK